METNIFTRDKKLPDMLRYSVIRKLLMALSGLLMVVFLYGHVIGNSILLSGEFSFVAYYHWLQNHPLLHYGVWIIIIVALWIHLIIGIYHWWYNRTTQPVRYKKKHYQITTWAARSMIVSGIIIVLFLILHIAQVRDLIDTRVITTSQQTMALNRQALTNSTKNSTGYHDVSHHKIIHTKHLSQLKTSTQQGEANLVYTNLMVGFENWRIVLFYLVAQLALALHLYHGLWSQFQTLGIYHPRYNHLRRPFSVLIGVGIALLNSILVLLCTPAGKQILETVL